MGTSIKFEKKQFSQDIETYVEQNKCTYIDAILIWCEKNEIEPDTVGKLVSKPIKERLEHEMREINLLPKFTPLPFTEVE